MATEGLSEREQQMLEHLRQAHRIVELLPWRKRHSGYGTMVI